MAVDQRRRQKKLERRKAKQKAERRELAQRRSQGIAARMELAASAPILHCCRSADLWVQGIGYVLLSRALKDGQVAFATFLVDVYCLGVKDVMFDIAPRGRYERDLYGKMTDRAAMLPMQPEAARKLVEGAVQYALDLGLPPHADYRTAKPIFGEISAEACTEEFTFGRDGKPCFMPGPFDNAARCEQIFRAIAKHLGEDPQFLIPI